MADQNLTAEAVLTRARDILNERGWTQGRLHDPATGRVCILGAVNVAICGEPHMGPAPDIRARDKWRFAMWNTSDLLDIAIDDIEPEPIEEEVRSPAMFNDAPGRTKDEVIALIDAAIIRAQTPKEPAC